MTTKSTASGAAELKAAFEEFLKKYKALEAEKDKLTLGFMRQTDEIIARELVADLRQKANAKK